MVVSLPQIHIHQDIRSLSSKKGATTGLIIIVGRRSRGARAAQGCEAMQLNRRLLPGEPSSAQRTNHGGQSNRPMPSGGVLSLSDPVDNPQLTQEEMNAIVSEAHSW